MLGDSVKINTTTPQNLEISPYLEPKTRVVSVKKKTVKKRKVPEKAGIYTEREQKAALILRDFSSKQRAAVFQSYLKKNGINGPTQLAKLTGLEEGVARNIVIHGLIPTANQNKKIIDTINLNLLTIGN
ncbi:MAG: hypothetical protein KC589_02010 [Nanoarchaeota archaeon]|nr:hypothetical protein [Nanoarchaeota archaeon]